MGCLSYGCKALRRLIIGKTSLFENRKSSRSLLPLSVGQARPDGKDDREGSNSRLHEKSVSVVRVPRDYPITLKQIRTLKDCCFVSEQNFFFGRKLISLKNRRKDSKHAEGKGGDVSLWNVYLVSIQLGGGGGNK